MVNMCHSLIFFLVGAYIQTKNFATYRLQNMAIFNKIFDVLKQKFQEYVGSTVTKCAS